MFGFEKLVILFMIIPVLVFVPLYLVYSYGKNKGRLQEREKWMKEKKGQDY